MKVLTTTGYAFVYFEDERDAADAIRGTDNMPFGYERRRLSVEWAKVMFPSPSFLYLRNAICYTFPPRKAVQLLTIDILFH